MNAKKDWVAIVTLLTCGLSGCQSSAPAGTALPEKSVKIEGAKIPADKQGLIMRVLGLNEQDVIKGLGVFAGLSNGRYPSSLDAKTTIAEANALLRAKYGEALTNQEKKESDQNAYDIFFAVAYYDKLAREKKNVAYYGDKVTVEDSDAVLVRWKEYKGKYRVILGDLRIESVTAEKLGELEKGLVE